MVQTIASFFEINNFIVYSVYGQVFFVLGLAVAFVRTKHSQLPLARSLWLLAGFGITHAFNEWASVFIPVQATYMPPAIIEGLHALHYCVGAFSYLLLFQFGIALVAGPRVPRVLSLVPSLFSLIWLAGFATALWLTGAPPTALERYVEAGMRYGLAFPASLLTAYGFLGQARRVREMDLPHIARYLSFAAAAFVAYAIVGGLVVPRLDLPPATWLNYDILLESFGIPAAVFRSVCGLAIAYFVVRSLQIFDVEADRFLLAMERRQVLSRERERIGRDLHDGIIQSIYAAGLALEDASYTVPVDQTAAQAKMAGVMASLNELIGEIRSYIYNLSMAMDGHDLAAEAEVLVERLRVGNSFTVRFVVRGKEPPLGPKQRSHLLQILHEAMSNVSKHSQARTTQVEIVYAEDGVQLTVRDDGIGFTVADLDDAGRGGYRNGLRNMAERAHELGGSLDVQSNPGKGTTVVVAVPLREPAGHDQSPSGAGEDGLAATDAPREGELPSSSRRVEG